MQDRGWTDAGLPPPFSARYVSHEIDAASSSCAICMFGEHGSDPGTCPPEPRGLRRLAYTILSDSKGCPVRLRTLEFVTCSDDVMFCMRRIHHWSRACIASRQPCRATITSCARGDTIRLRPRCNFTIYSHLFARWPLFRHVGYLGHQQQLLTFDLLTLKVVSESRVTWATSVPILVFLGLSVLDLGPMYNTDRCQTKASLNASTLLRGDIVTMHWCCCYWVIIGVSFHPNLVCNISTMCCTGNITTRGQVLAEKLTDSAIHLYDIDHLLVIISSITMMMIHLWSIHLYNIDHLFILIISSITLMMIHLWSTKPPLSQLWCFLNPAAKLYELFLTVSRPKGIGEGGLSEPLDSLLEKSISMRNY